MTKKPRYQTIAMTGLGETPRTDHQAYAVRVLAPGGHDHLDIRWDPKRKGFAVHASGAFTIEPHVSNDMTLRLCKLPRAPRKRKMPDTKDQP